MAISQEDLARDKVEIEKFPDAYEAAVGARFKLG
jgi:hypothetical protein